MLRGDTQRLRDDRTSLLYGSTRARQILDNWAEYLPKFIKIMLWITGVRFLKLKPPPKNRNCWLPPVKAEIGKGRSDG